MATPWERETARRKALIEQIYYQELGRRAVDKSGMNYWLSVAQQLNNDDKLREAIRFAGSQATKNRTGSDLPGGPSRTAADLNKDAQYRAFLRQMAFDETQIQSGLDRARTSALNKIATQAPLYDQQRAQSGRAVNDSFESRGMFRSGARLDERAQRRDAIDLSQRQFEQSQRTSIQDAEYSAANDLARLRRQRMEQELAARDRLTRGSVV